MTFMSDKTTVFRALSVPGFVFIRPSREIDMQDELHDAARDRIRSEGLPADTPYAGWHWQQHGFTGKGQLEGFQYVYWGGDAAFVRQRLDSLSADGFLVLGGRTSDEPFALARDAHPTAAAADEAAAIAARLRILSDDNLVRLGGVALRDNDLPLSHDVLVAVGRGELPGDLARLAVATIQQYDAITTADVDSVGAGWRELLGPDAAHFARAAQAAGHPTGEAMVAEVAAADAAARAARKAAEPAVSPAITAIKQIARRWAKDEWEVAEIAAEVDTLRAVLADPDATEPQLALALELLTATDALRAADIHPLRKGWRKRLLRKPDPYLTARPAVVGFALGLLVHGDDLGPDVVAAVMADERQWMDNVRVIMLGVLAELGVESALERLSEVGADSGSGAIAHVRAIALLEDEEAEVIAGRLWSETPEFPPYQRAHYAAAAVALDPVPRIDWDISTFRFKLDRQRDTARRMAADARLPRGMRAWLQEHAGEGRTP